MQKVDPPPSRRAEIQQLYDRYLAEEPVMSAASLLNFLQKEQMEITADEETASNLIGRYEIDESAKESACMTFAGFFRYMESKDCCIFDQTHTDVYQDMDQPLTSYFISSSHNTYLTRDQLVGKSDLDAYVTALRKGCRCLEIDIWDGPDMEPLVYHGHTLTTKLLFKDVIETVEQHAFEVSAYPVILSLENHCCPEQQEVMAQYLTNILGEKLLKVPLDHPTTGELPSPNDLKYKILVKYKKQNPPKALVTPDVMMSDVDPEVLAEIASEVTPDVALGTEGEASVDGGAGSREKGEQQEDEEEESSSEDDDSDESDEEQEKQEGDEEGPSQKKSKSKSKKKTKKATVAKALSDLVIYTRSVKFKDFGHSKDNQNYYENTSMAESKAKKLAKNLGADFVHHNQRFLSRIYPAGSRVFSSNYNPQDFWNVGSQLVALNFQTLGLPMDLNDGRFQDNGGCGYTLKPQVLLAEEDFDPGSQSDNLPTYLLLKVISGANLPVTRCGKALDPFVRVEIHGTPTDSCRKCTPTVNSNSLTPHWDTNMDFSITVPELCLVRFCVKHQTGPLTSEFVGQYTLPFASMKKGYRWVPLQSQDGCSLDPASLLVFVWFS